MDESVVGIVVALHAAFACPATRWLDLDGSFDLSRDFATGGSTAGRMSTPTPGLGANHERNSPLTRRDLVHFGSWRRRLRWRRGAAR
jgi:hypothetical protein